MSGEAAAAAASTVTQQRQDGPPFCHALSAGLSRSRGGGLVVD